MNAKIPKEQLEQAATGRYQGWVERIAASDLAGWQCVTVRGGGRTRDCLVPHELMRKHELTPQSVVRFDGRPFRLEVRPVVESHEVLPPPNSN